MQKSNLYPNEYIPFTKRREGDIPPSENSFLINICGFTLAIIVMLFIKQFKLMSNHLCVITTFVLVQTITILTLEYIFKPQKSVFSKITIKRKFNIIRWLTRMLALFCIWGGIAFLYWLLPIYNGALFIEYFEVLHGYWWLFCLLGAIYFALEDCINDRIKDSYWQLGRWLIGFRKDANKKEMVELIRGWGVKFFYLALMLPYFSQRLMWFMNADLSQIFNELWNIYEFFKEFIFFIDLAVAATGYIMTFKLFNTQIRSSEPTVFGWLVAIGCYWPFWDVLYGYYYFSYSNGVLWSAKLADSYLLYIWMFLILACAAIYSLATLALGIRFSNLTYRGLVTSGPYRFTKHPAYVFKNISWWLIYMPFLACEYSIEVGLRGTLLLFGVNLIYYARAKTEENHLSHYPEYVEYALMMNEKSIFAPLTKILPFLKYKAPKNYLKNQ